MYKVLLVSDSGVPTGYGRIADNVGIRLTQRGIHIVGASLAYDGLLPPKLGETRLPYHVATLQVKRPTGQWVEDVVKLVGAVQPDIVMVCQDMPYAEAVRNAPIDWSKHKLIIITPVDGVPIEPNWVKLMQEADGGLVISEFGVQAYREAGAAVDLCRPGVDVNTFYELPAQQKAALRQQLGVPQNAFILGTMAQNQGRKAIPFMLDGFFKFAKDKPEAYYLLDMDEISPAGWNIKSVCQQNGWDKNRLIFRSRCHQAGIHNLRDRYNLLDAHAVLAHREGYGLPLAEAQACGVVSIAMDYCSGAEICGDGKGVLIPHIDVMPIGTWGGARDALPDVTAFVDALDDLYKNPDKRNVIRKTGQAWSRQQTWDMAADAVWNMMLKVMTPPVIHPVPIPVQQPVAPPPEPAPKKGAGSVIVGKNGVTKVEDGVIIESPTIQLMEIADNGNEPL